MLRKIIIILSTAVSLIFASTNNRTQANRTDKETLAFLLCALKSSQHTALSNSSRASENLFDTVTHIAPIQDIIRGYIYDWRWTKKIELCHISDSFDHESVINTLHFLPGLPLLARINNFPVTDTSSNQKRIGMNTVNLETDQTEDTLLPYAPICINHVAIDHAPYLYMPPGCEQLDAWHINETLLATNFAILKQRYLALALRGGDIDIYDTKTGELVHQFVPQDPSIFSLAFSADGKYLATGARHGLIQICDLERPDQSFDLGRHTGAVYVLIFHKNCLLSASHDGTVKIWDITHKKYIDTLARYHKPVTSMALSSNGKYLAVSTSNAPLYVQSDNSGHAIAHKDPEGDLVDIFESQQYLLKAE